jgi:ribosomal protein S18 acetylase RimI-like enzyme
VRLTCAGRIDDEGKTFQSFHSQHPAAEFSGGFFVPFLYDEDTDMHGIRRANSQDVEAVRRLVREAYAQWIALIGREPMPMKADYERAVRDHEIDLLYADRDLVALIEVIVHSDHLFIENVAVIPHRQRQGFGRYLLSHAEEKARKANLGELRLLTNQAFEANIRLYESVGFRIDRTEAFAGGGITVYMSKAL